MAIIEVDGLWFVVHTPVEHWRAKTLLTKEPGTIAWLQESCRPGDVMLDVGANVGAYTLYAARLVGATGHVIAIEPHVGTALALLQNVRRNAFDDRVAVLTVALGARVGWRQFHYASLVAGTSGHQLGHRRNEAGQEFTPSGSELKYMTTIDELVIGGVILPPTVVKIDVDGNEVDVLTGMRAALENSVHALQVEMHATTMKEIDALVQGCGFKPVRRHDTAQGAKAILDGADRETVAHNMVYTRR